MLLNDFDKIIVVDPGKNSVKAMAFTPFYELIKHNVFPSKTKQQKNFNNVYSGDNLGDKQYKIELFLDDNDDETSKFLVGNGINEDYNLAATKNNYHHKVCIYSAIANFIEKPNERIHLVVGYPSSDYNNSSQRKRFENLMCPKLETPIAVTIDGCEKTFVITNFKVYPEGIALKPKVLNQRKWLNVIDIGGQNINYRKYDESGNAVTSYSRDKAGMNHLCNYLKNNLREFVEADCIDVETINYENAVKKGYIEELHDDHIYDYETTQDFITAKVGEFVDRNIIQKLKTEDFDISQRGHLLVFIGGGSLALRKYLEEKLTYNKGNMKFYNSAQWDNCISYIGMYMFTTNNHRREDKSILLKKIFFETENI